LSTEHLSNANNEDEQTLNTATKGDNLDALFAAAYSGNDEESSRLIAEAAEEETEDTDDTTQETEEVDTATPIDVDPKETPDPDSETQQVDELATLREELHRAKSDAGRARHLNKKVQELERQLTALRSPAKGPDNNVAIPDKLRERLAKYKEIDPELAEILEETYKSSASATSEVADAYNRYVALQNQKQEEEYVRSEYQKVVATVPEAEDVFRSREWEQWVNMLSPNHRAMAESSDANEVLTAIQAFKVDAEKLFGGYKWGKTTPAPQAPAPSATAVAAEKQRANRLASSANVKPTAPRATTEPDLETLFKQVYNENLGIK